MSVLSDKEVGELWRYARLGRYWTCTMGCKDDIKKLIRKLVEERSWAYRARCAHAAHDRAENAGGACDHTLDALRDFGIDPKNWA